MNINKLFATLGLSPPDPGDLCVFSPIHGKSIATIQSDTPESCAQKIQFSKESFDSWKTIPAPARGELVRLYAQELRKHKHTLGKLITIECGKILSEGEGEVQEMIDICDFAVGLSRQLYGLTIASERPAHTLREVWHPMGPTGIITAFNFPMAVWAWNAALAIVCGNSILWKPSEKTPLCALACQGLLEKVSANFSQAPSHLSQVIIGGSDVGEQLSVSEDIPLISATGSCRMGREVGAKVAQRFGRSILELGGNNAMIISNRADIDMALEALVFGAVGTAGQRCTTTRRVFAHRDIYEALLAKLEEIYPRLPIGDPLEADNLVGPLIDQYAYQSMQATIEKHQSSGCKIIGGERVYADRYPHAYYVRPALIDARNTLTNNYEETFAPLVYLFDYEDLSKAIRRQNEVSQGLSSAIFTNDLREAEYFLSAQGSDCGIANVNVGTSGAEIGGAFGGEKHTGGGRESGSDAWKGYMRRMTTTVNYSHELPLAQGVKFEFSV